MTDSPRIIGDGEVQSLVSIAQVLEKDYLEQDESGPVGG